LSAPKRLGAPRHFYLLWDEDLDELQPLLKVIVAERASIVGHWYKLYELHFGGNASLSEIEFRRIFETALLLGDAALLDKDIDPFAENITKLGEELATRRVPLREVIVSLHLFEEAVLRVCTPDKAVSLQTYVIFDKLSHLRTLLMTDAYMRIQAAETSARIIELEQEAAQLPHDARKNFHGLVGSSVQMRMLYERVEAAARTAGIVLIVGESGTGSDRVFFRTSVAFSFSRRAGLPSDAPLAHRISNNQVSAAGFSTRPSQASICARVHIQRLPTL
jgi:hypothetical protein